MTLDVVHYYFVKLSVWEYNNRIIEKERSSKMGTYLGIAYMDRKDEGSQGGSAAKQATAEFRCAFTVQISGNNASADWYTLWGAAVVTVG